MSGHWKDYWQELHHGEQEYCRKSGPLNSRKISAAKPKNTILANGMGLVTSAAAAIGLAAVIAALYITSAPVVISKNSASINVNVHNRQEHERIEYVLTKENDPDIPIDSGIIGPDEDRLEFEDLESNTSYKVEYFVERDGERQRVGEFRFTTDGPVEEGTSTPPTTDPPPASSEDATDPLETTEPEEDTTGLEEETSEQLEETTEEGTEESSSKQESESTETESTTRPTEPETESSVEETTVPSTRPSEPETVPSTEETTVPSTRPSDPETESSTPESGTTAPEEADPSLDIQVKAELISAKPGGDDEIISYTCTERHTFTNVSSADAVVTVLQNDQEVPYQMSYNATTRTMIIEFLGYAIPTGETADSLVTVEDVDGRTATSSLTITAPKLNSLSLDIEDNGDGTFTYTISADVTQPSHGHLMFDEYLWPSRQKRLQESFTNTDGTVVHSVVSSLDDMTGIVYAYVDLYAKWSLQDTADKRALYIWLDNEMEYVASGISFELRRDTGINNDGSEYTYYDYPYEYDVIAVFGGSGDITPISIEFSRAKAYKELGDDGKYYYVYEDYLTQLTLENPTLGEDGLVQGKYTMPEPGEEYGIQNGERHAWTATLTYRDKEGNLHQRTLSDYIEHFLEYGGIMQNATLRRLEDESYEVELDLSVLVYGGHPGEILLDRVIMTDTTLEGQQLDVEKWEVKDDTLHIVGVVPIDESEGFSVGYTIYAYWSWFDADLARNTGAGVTFMTPHHVSEPINIVRDESGAIIGCDTKETYIFEGQNGMFPLDYNLISVEISDPDNVTDLKSEYIEENREIRVTFTRVNQVPGDEVKSGIKLTYQDGSLTEDGTLNTDGYRVIDIYETYVVGEDAS